MSPLKSYIEGSLLIPPESKERLLSEEAEAQINEDLREFIEIYSPLEKEILAQVNQELKVLNAQITAHIRKKEEELTRYELAKMEQELAYL